MFKGPRIKIPEFVGLRSVYYMTLFTGRFQPGQNVGRIRFSNSSQLIFNYILLLQEWKLIANKNTSRYMVFKGPRIKIPEVVGLGLAYYTDAISLCGRRTKGREGGS